MVKKNFSKISSIIQDAQKGRMFILVDDKNRENEGDLIIPASKCNSRKINFMAKHGRGLICLALTKKQIDILKLPLMSPNNKSRMQTAFTISIEAKRGITTGISAQDRARTIKTAIRPKVKKSDIVSPGHVFPLVAKNGGVLERAGHTEASVDISKLSNLNPSSVICEVMNEDGRMARLNDLYKFSKKHKIKLASIENLIAYRLRERDNIICDVAVPFTTATLGGKIEVPTIDRKMVNISIPKGMQSGHKLRVKEKGMSILRTNRRGDMIVKVHAETPVNLSKDQEALLNQFNDSLTKKNSTMTEGFFDKVKKMFG